MAFLRRNGYCIAGTNDLGSLAGGLHQTEAIQHVKGLTHRVRVPGGAAARGKPDTNRLEMRGRRCAYDFVEPDGAGEVGFGSFAAGMKFGGEYLHRAAHSSGRRGFANEAQGNWTGAPRSPERTWAGNDVLSNAFFKHDTIVGFDTEKAFRGAAPIVFVPRTLGRTWGTRPVSLNLDANIGSLVGGLIDKLEAYRHEPEG